MRDYFAGAASIDTDSSEKSRTFSNDQAGSHVCIVDLQKDLYSQYYFSSTGNILIVALGARGISEIKKLMKKQHRKKNMYTILKSAK